MRTLVRGWSAAKRITRCSLAKPSRVTRNCLVPGGRYRTVTGVTPQPTPSIVTRAPAGSVTISSSGPPTGGVAAWSVVAAGFSAAGTGVDPVVPDVVLGGAGATVSGGAVSIVGALSG